MPETRSMTGSVYFVQAMAGGPIKIGFAGDLNRRLAELQGMSPFPLRVLATIRNATFETEHRLHQDLAWSRVHGEWFEPTPRLLRYIDFRVDSDLQLAESRLRAKAGA